MKSVINTFSNHLSVIIYRINTSQIYRYFIIFTNRKNCVAYHFYDLTFVLHLTDLSVS